MKIAILQMLWQTFDTNKFMALANSLNSYWKVQYFPSLSLSSTLTLRFCRCWRPSLQSWHPPLPLFELTPSYCRALLANRHLCGRRRVHFSSVSPGWVHRSLCAGWQRLLMLFLLLFSELASKRPLDWHSYCVCIRFFDRWLQVRIPAVSFPIR